MGNIVVGVGDLKVSKDLSDELVTHSLGSCIGVAVHDPLAKVGGMLHIMLPYSKLSPQRAQTTPCMFADTGLPRLFKAVYNLGAQKRRLRVVLAGGARIITGKDRYNIGKRNYIAVRHILWRNSVFVTVEEVGGTATRTMNLSVATGEVKVRIDSGLIKKL